jgi:hypothetical protein
MGRSDPYSAYRYGGCIHDFLPVPSTHNKLQRLLYLVCYTLNIVALLRGRNCYLCVTNYLIVHTNNRVV